MEKDYLKTAINILINNKTTFTNILIVTIAGTIGLLLKWTNTRTNLFEVFLIIIGLLLTLILAFLLINISEKINKLLSQLKGEK